MINRILRRLVAEGRLWLPVSQKEVAQNVVVSFTSYPARLPQLHLVDINTLAICITTR